MADDFDPDLTWPRNSPDGFIPSIDAVRTMMGKLAARPQGVQIGNRQSDRVQRDVSRNSIIPYIKNHAIRMQFPMFGYRYGNPTLVPPAPPPYIANRIAYGPNPTSQAGKLPLSSWYQNTRMPSGQIDGDTQPNMSTGTAGEVNPNPAELEALLQALGGNQ